MILGGHRQSTVSSGYHNIRLNVVLLKDGAKIFNQFTIITGKILQIQHKVSKIWSTRKNVSYQNIEQPTSRQN